MTQTEKMVEEMNNFFREIGEKELAIPNQLVSERQALSVVKVEYKKRLLRKFPLYRLIPFEKLIPDLFLQALRNRESELQTERPGKSDATE